MGGVWKAWGDERGLLLQLALHGRERHGHPIHPPTHLANAPQTPAAPHTAGRHLRSPPRGPGSYPATQSSADAETHTPPLLPRRPQGCPGSRNPAPCRCLAPWRDGGLAVRGWCGSNPEWPVNAQGPQAGTRELAHVGPPTPTLLFLVKTIWGAQSTKTGSHSLQVEPSGTAGFGSIPSPLSSTR